RPDRGRGAAARGPARSPLRVDGPSARRRGARRCRGDAHGVSAGPPIRRGLAEALISALAAAGLACLIITNGARLLAEVGCVALFWLPAAAVLWRRARAPLAGPGLALRGAALAFGAFVAGALAAGLLVESPGRLARHAVQFLIVWLPLLGVVVLRHAAGRGRELMT